MPSGCCRENRPKVGQGKGKRGSRKNTFETISIILARDLDLDHSGRKEGKEKRSDSGSILRKSHQDLLMNQRWKRVRRKAESRLTSHFHSRAIEK